MAQSPKFLDVLGKLMNGGAMSWDDFMEHFDLQNDTPPEGPAIGSTLPAFALVDQSGATRTFADVAGPAGLLLVFVRSAHWCGYCRNQLGELNLSARRLREAGIGVAAIAPDAPDVVAEFADAQKIAYPILSDHGANWIERIGLLNTNVEGSPLHYDGRIPFPAHIMLSPNGKVIAKDIAPDLRHRPSATTLVMQTMGPLTDSPRVTIDREELLAQISIATNRLHAGQEIALHVEIAIRPGWHAYGQVGHGRYRALAIRFDDVLLERQEIEFPAAKDTFLEELGETAPVYDGVIEARGKLRLCWSPPVHGSRHLTGLADRLARMQTPPGDYVLNGALDYQACGHGVCTPPQSIPFSFPITIVADLDKTRGYFPAETGKAFGER